MADFDFNKLQGLDLSGLTANFRNPVQDMVEKTISENKEIMRSIETTRRKREDEQLSRHNELINALKEAGAKGATIIVGDNAKDIQIQQNSAGASQTMDNAQGLDYEKTLLVLKEIRSYFEYPQFQQTYGANTENVKKIVEDTIIAVEHEKNEGLIKKSLRLLTDLTVGTAGSLIATGILALLGTLSIG